METLPEISVLEWIFKAGCALLAFFGIRTLNRIDEDMKALEKRQSDDEKEHWEHKAYCEREFERKDTVQASLARIHDRLDQIFELVAEGKN